MAARFSAPVHTGSAAHRASYTKGTGSFPGVKRPRGGVNNPPPSSAQVKERVQLCFYSPSAPSWPLLGWTLPFTYLLLYLLTLLTLLTYFTYLLTYLLTTTIITTTNNNNNTSTQQGHWHTFPNHAQPACMVMIYELHILQWQLACSFGFWNLFLYSCTVTAWSTQSYNFCDKLVMPTYRYVNDFVPTAFRTSLIHGTSFDSNVLIFLG